MGTNAQRFYFHNFMRISISEFIRIVKKIKKIGYSKLIDLSTQITDFGAFSQTNFIEFLDEGILFLRNQDIKNGMVKNQNNTYIAPEVYERLTLHLQVNDILIPRVGTLGDAAIVDSKLLPCTANQNLAVVRLHNIINPHCLVVILLSKIGKQQIEKTSTGNVQQWLNLEAIGNLYIPAFSMDFQTCIAAIKIKSDKMVSDSLEMYAKAEVMLEMEIGIDISSITNGGVSVKSFTESFGITGRLDAEYYQPKYDDFENHVLNYENGHTTPSNEFELIKTKCSRELESYPYVEIGDIDIGNGSAEYNVVSTKDLPANAKIMTQKGDLLISTVRPYRGAISILETDDLLVSGAFTVLRENGSYPAQTLQVLFRTKLYKDWLLKFNVGTSYPVIKDDDVLNIPIPVLKDDIHKKIKEYVQDSQVILTKAKELLEYAKQAIEMAIEKDENVAIAWLNIKIDELTKDD